MARSIEIEVGVSVIVDDCDYEWLSGYNWFTRKLGKTDGSSYMSVCRRSNTIYMARDIMQPPAHLLVDHINRDPLDNRRANLRLATRSENNCNIPSRIGASGFRGVWADGERWLVAIKKNGKRIRFGGFSDPVEAAKAYDRAAIELHGTFAVLNFPNP